MNKQKNGSRKIKILFVLPNLIGGGAERVFTHLVNHIDREKFEPHLALGAKRGAYIGDINADISVYELGGERSRKAIPSLIKLVRKVRPDVVFSTLGMNFANSLGKILYPRKTRVVLREGNSVTAFLQDVGRKNPALALFYKKIYHRLYNRADIIICQSDFMRRDIAENFAINREKLKRIHNPVDFEKIDNLLNQETDNLFPQDVFNFITVGKFHYHKGYDVLLRAFAEAREKNANISLTMLGEGEERQKLEDLRDELNLKESVRMPGFAENPYIYLERADAFVSSSRYEGFSNVIVESLACGTPVVATDCPSANREVLRESENGWFAEMENETSLAEAMLKAVAEAKNLDAAKIRAECKSRFSLEEILPLYEELLKP